MASHFPQAPSGYRIEDVDRFVAQVYERMQTAVDRFRAMEAEIDSLRAENAALRKGASPSRDDSVIVAARQEAESIIESARIEAREKVLVAQAEAREMAAEERRKVAGELEMLAVVREMVAAERDNLLATRPDVREQLVSAVAALGSAKNARTLGSLSSPVPQESDPIGGPGGFGRRLAGTTAEFDDAFVSFFDSELEVEPSRRWILGGK